MAIKTKKISELSDIITSANLDSIVDDGLYILGCKGNTTGKVSTKNIFAKVDSKINAAIEELESKMTRTIQTFSNETPALLSARSMDLSDSPSITKLEEATSQCTCDISDLSAKIDTLDAKQKNYAFSVAQKIDALDNEVIAQREKLAKLEQFIKELQKDGYLTLAEIKKSAANCFPVATEETTEITE